ncbi:MAG TPA: peptidoglycan DD-metalloendopeptidase family protein [Polyangiaceae bacterium]|nr:peptidoglycan DD-metalloendopeptidase family protein [Polyangiaceae bacterium]
MKPLRLSSALGVLLLAASAAAIGAPADAAQAPQVDDQTDPSEVAESASPLSNPSAVQRDLGGDAERRLNELNRQSQAAKAELERLAKETDSAHARTVMRGRVYVRLARAGLLPVGGGFDALVEHAVELERLRNAIGRDLKLERELSARRVALGRDLLELEARRSTLENEVRAMSVAQSALLSEQDRASAFARAFSGGVGSAHTAVYGAGPADSAPLAGGFGSLKGRLPFPITGRSLIRSASRPGSEGPGLEMFAPAGSVVRAVHAGRVAFADSYAAYGRAVILDHGAGYYTVSANLGSIDVKVGDDLPAGMRLGTVGNSDGTPRLYFEIRAGTNTLPPAEWFGI